MLMSIASYVNRHHLALFALFFALGGTSFAAGNALVARNSVGTTPARPSPPGHCGGSARPPCPCKPRALAGIALEAQ